MLLRRGDKGEDIEDLQEALLSLGFHPGPIDGKFGRLTELAIERFQKSQKTLVDGICGPSTMAILNSSLSKKSLATLRDDSNKSDNFENNDKLLGWVACPADKIAGKGGYARVTLRSDAAESYKKLREEVVALGGVLTSAGGRRGLSSKAGPARSRKSMHYVGLALDLALPTGMQNPDEDEYLIVMEDDRRWTIWCKSENESVPEVTIPATHVTRRRGKSVIRIKEVTTRAFNLTELFEKHGWKGIRGRRSFFKGGAYGGAEWWHFQYEGALEKNVSTFGNELLKVYSLSQARRFIYWDESKNCVFGKNWF